MPSLNSLRIRSTILDTLSKFKLSNISSCELCILNFLESKSLPFLPMEITEVLTLVFESVISCIALITLELNPPQRPLLEVIAINNSFFIARTSENEFDSSS